ncbi:MAG: ABC transporter ATP-binding protein [Spirochaetota bacterium]|jgi:iron complex transport system ATP-binding protein|nr:ABC transporter ATP-binding protein [Spirochaetota bacterium]
MIVCEALAYTAGGFALGPVDLELRPGVSVVLGPNGAGKSSLLALIMGLFRPKSGRVTIEGHNPLLVSPALRAGLAALSPQTIPPVFGICTADFIAAGAFRKTHHIYSDPSAARAQGEIMELANLSAQGGQDFASLSGGEKRRALLARALVQDAAWTLLDEPTSSLDYAHNRALLDLLRTLKHKGRNLVLVTHDADFAMAIADRIIFLRKGKIHSEGVPAAALTEAALREVFGAAFTRTPAGRVLPDYI